MSNLTSDWDKLRATTQKFKIGDTVRLRTGTAFIRVIGVTLNSVRGEYINTGITIERPPEDFVKLPDPHQDHIQWSENNLNRNIIFDSTIKIPKTITGNVRVIIPPTKENTMKLYQFKINDVDNYGHYLATDSNGNWVMEVKGSGSVVAVPKDQVQEVLPYTVGVKFGGSNKVYHYLAEAGKVDLGFYIMTSVVDTNNSYVIVEVVELDTKSPSATKDFEPKAKLNTL